MVLFLLLMQDKKMLVDVLWHLLGFVSGVWRRKSNAYIHVCRLDGQYWQVQPVTLSSYSWISYFIDHWIVRIIIIIWIINNYPKNIPLKYSHTKLLQFSCFRTDYLLANGGFRQQITLHENRRETDCSKPWSYRGTFSVRKSCIFLSISYPPGSAVYNFNTPCEN